LRFRRSQAGLSQEALALRADVNRTCVAKLELAGNQPSLSVLLSLADALGVELPALIRGTLPGSHTSCLMEANETLPPKVGKWRHSRSCAVYPSRRFVWPKMRSFIDFMVEHFGDAPDWDRGIS
jgi:transcriptional regulator with XRE-family HTH domain